MSFRTAWGAAACAVLVTLAPAARAQDWPNRMVLTISPLTAGNAADTVARIVLDQVGKQVGQSFVIENRPGAGGTTGSAAAAKADADGYTLFLLTASQGSYAALHKSLPYDPVRDFIPVAMFGVQPSVLVAAPSKGWTSVADLVNAAKAAPGVLNFASAGLGSASHWAGERFRLAAGINVQHIPFRGPVEAFTEVMTGRVDFIFIGISSGLPFIQNKQLVPLAVSSAKRSPTLPDLPTTLEAGYKDSDFNYWNGMLMPAKTPGPIIERLNAETTKALALPEVQQKLTAQGVEPAPLSPSEIDAMIRREIALNLKIAKEAGLKFN